MFTPPRPDAEGKYDLKAYGTAGLTDLRNMAAQDHDSLVASISKDSPDEQALTQAEELAAFVAAADVELDKRATDAQRAQAQQPLGQRTVTAATETVTETPTEE